eukprot:Mrub_04308.p3 GENE.Mrub_04308~~Mrub_04308.p3  ORF type:complete len:109 (-),score=5.42 Mrub_04308:732-1058(-)
MSMSGSMLKSNMSLSGIKLNAAPLPSVSMNKTLPVRIAYNTINDPLYSQFNMLPLQTCPSISPRKIDTPPIEIANYNIVVNKYLLIIIFVILRIETSFKVLYIGNIID